MNQFINFNYYKAICQKGNSYKKKAPLFSQLDKQPKKLKNSITKKTQVFFPVQQKYYLKNEGANRQLNIEQLKSSMQLEQFPFQCIGLVIADFQQNGQNFRQYGTGTLIHNNIVITSAQNIYSRGRNKKCSNVKFIPGLSKNKHAGIHQVRQIYYPRPYQFQSSDFQKYNFAILELYDDLSQKYGYFGWRTDYKIDNENTQLYGYTFIQQKFELQHFRNINIDTKNLSSKMLSGCALLSKDENNNFYLIGMQTCFQPNVKIILRNEIRQLINNWMTQHELNLQQKDLNYQLCTYLCIEKSKWSHLNKINLQWNKIGDEGCKLLRDSHFNKLISIRLQNNNISAQGCLYLTQANWKSLRSISLAYNHLGINGCKYICQAQWINLDHIKLSWNNIGDQGCRYLRNSNWPHLKNIYLSQNNIGMEGCKLLKDTNWSKVKIIILSLNKISELEQIILIELWKKCEHYYY